MGRGGWEWGRVKGKGTGKMLLGEGKRRGGREYEGKKKDLFTACLKRRVWGWDRGGEGGSE
jgi:hypothetical protein